MERIIITFTKDGNFRGASATDFDGLPKPLDTVALAALLPDLNASALAKVAELETELKAASESVPTLTQERDTALAKVTELEARIVELTTVEPAETSIRAWQAKAVLSLMGLLESAEAVIDSLEEPQRTVVKSAWANNADFSRTAQTIIDLAAALQLTEAQLDEMFAQGAALSI